MATIESLQRNAIEYAERSHRNPLLRLTLGELVAEMIDLRLRDPDINKPENEIPESSKDNHQRYNNLIKELTLREREFKSYKQTPIY